MSGDAWKDGSWFGLVEGVRKSMVGARDARRLTTGRLFRTCCRSSKDVPRVGHFDFSGSPPMANMVGGFVSLSLSAELFMFELLTFS